MFTKKIYNIGVLWDHMYEYEKEFKKYGEILSINIGKCKSPEETVWKPIYFYKVEATRLGHFIIKMKTRKYYPVKRPLIEYMLNL